MDNTDKIINLITMENINQVLNSLVSIIMNPGAYEWVFYAKVISLLFCLFFVICIVYFLLKTNWLNLLVVHDAVEFFTFRPFGLKKIEKLWAKTVARLNTGVESEYKLAIIEADSLMDDVLKRMGFGGETLGERLGKLTTATIPNIEDLKTCHQLRNNIIHDPDYKLNLDDTKKTLASYEKAFRDLQAF